MSEERLRQEVFDRVVRHLLAQGRKSETRDDTYGRRCLYRGPDGLRCAVGALIDDAHYSPYLEDKTGSCEDVVLAVARSLGVDHRDLDPALLDGLQTIHDSRDVDHWRDALEWFADEYDLDASVLEEAAPC